MTQKQKTAVIALFRLIYNQDETTLHDKDLQNDILSVLEGILDNESEIHIYTNTKYEEER